MSLFVELREKTRCGCFKPWHDNRKSAGNGRPLPSKFFRYVNLRNSLDQSPCGDQRIVSVQCGFKDDALKF
ncbi:MAG: hypothetical protein IKU94_00640 [Bacteroidaceae bacterium]|nr:hypothetical protein [Bacteroidaceae bacterium]MBR4930456.1 hypothetical protein [Bacteroidaceae bacterium]